MSKGNIVGDRFEEAIVGTISVRDNITAAAGGGQANAVGIVAQISRVATVATTADSIKLPLAGPYIGAELTVINAGANSLNLYPAVGDQINALGANAAFAVAASKTATLTSMGGTQWHSMLSA